MTDLTRVPMKATWLAAADDTTKKAGAVRALVSAYGTKYRIGYATFHTIEMGAFAASLEAQDAIPLFWMHGWDWTDQAPVGDATGEESAAEGGLVLDGSLYADLDPEVARLHRATVNGAIREWSIGYRVLASRRDPADDMHEFVTEAELLEASLVLRGANPDTKTLQVASARGVHRITTASGAVVETDDDDLVARLTLAAPAVPITGAPPAEIPTDRLASLLGRKAVREMFGDALAGNPTN